MTAPVTHILPLTLIRRTRLLPAAGNVLVHSGQRVNALDIVAETFRFPDHQMIDVAKIFQAERANELDEWLQVKPGDQLQVGDVIAQKKGLFRKVVRAQQAGRVASIINGQVWIEGTGKRFELRAGYSGVVSEVIPERGIVVTTHGALIQAAWGNGKIEESPIVYHPRSEDEELLPDMIDIAFRGGIVFGGYCGSAETLQQAATLPVRGIILGSMAAELVPLAISMPYAIILTEGFGRIPVNHNVYTILTSNTDRQVSMLASSWDPSSGDRPEITIALPAEGKEPKEITMFRTGQQVRFLGEPVAGEVGVLENLDQENRTGVVRLTSNQRIHVPLVNLDVLE
jgi:hypothetical protein